MTLAGGRVAFKATESVKTNVEVRYGRIRQFHTGRCRDRVLDLSGFMLLPGLINAHDHLEFNLFPRLGNGPYPNATEWAKDIYHPHDHPIREHLEIPKPIRLFWGGMKNLLSGVTTVSHHNPYQPSVFDRRFPVRVLKRFGWAHSLNFSPDAERRYRETPADVPFIIHAAEGSNEEASEEICRLHRLGMLGSSTVLVHAVALAPRDVELIARSGTSLIWCPTSNYFTLGRTISLDALSSGIPIALGTDSALTGNGDIINELQAARSHVDAARLFEIVTSEAAGILRLTSGEGTIREGGVADFVVVEHKDQSPAEALVRLRPDLVILNGRVKLFSARMADRLRFCGTGGFEAIHLEGRGRLYVAYRVAAFADRVKRHLGENFRLAGKKVMA